MNTKEFDALIAIVVAFIFFFVGWQAGKKEGYNNGFDAGASAAEQYAMDCYNDLDYETRRKFGISAYDASLAISKHDGEESGEMLFNKYGDVVNAHYALEYFYTNIWDDLNSLHESALSLGDIPSD